MKNFGLLLFFPILAFADFLPHNSQKIPASQKGTGLTEEQFNKIIDKVEKVYAPVVYNYGGILWIWRKWNDPTVNAGTYRVEGDFNWYVNLYGGFARHPMITEDGFALVACHEIGHHIGGAPKKEIEPIPFWAGAEGQSDYWTTLKCLRQVFAMDNSQEAIANLNVPKIVITECQKSFKTDWESALCIRTSMAGLSVANVMADTQEISLPSFEDKDQTVATSTNKSHPSPQCRLDTYFQGSICPVSSYVWISQENAVTGTCHPSLGYTRGNRPLCWYTP